MLPDDPRHGQNRGYIAGCRNECCKTAHADYKRNRRTRIYLAQGPMKIDGTGTRRRIQALVALGYTMQDIDEALGRTRGFTFHMMHRPEVYRTSAQRIAAIYDEWSMTIPPTNLCATRNRNLAARKGWLPPLAWDDEYMDDPNYQPRLGTNDRNKNDVDRVLVDRFLAGAHHLNLTRAERLEVARRWTGTQYELAHLTGWNVTRYFPRQDGAA